MEKNRTIKITWYRYSSNPTWSPNGNRIAFVFNGNSQVYLGNLPGQEQNYGIHIIDANGGNEERLSPFISKDFEPSWSPDSKKIVFSSLINNNYDIYVMNADASNRIRLTTDSAKEYAPTWSPDGNKIAYMVSKPGINWWDKETTGIYTMNADGSNQKLIMNGGSRPDWYPDGTKIVFLSGSDVCIMNSDGSNVRKIAVNACTEYTPRWSPVMK